MQVVTGRRVGVKRRQQWWMPASWVWGRDPHRGLVCLDDTLFDRLDTASWIAARGGGSPLLHTHWRLDSPWLPKRQEVWQGTPPLWPSTWCAALKWTPGRDCDQMAAGEQASKRALSLAEADGPPFCHICTGRKWLLLTRHPPAEGGREGRWVTRETGVKCSLLPLRIS